MHSVITDEAVAPAGFPPRSHFPKKDRRNRLILFSAALLSVLCGLLGASAQDRLTAGGWFPPDARALNAERVLGKEFGRGTPDLMLLVRAGHDGVTADAPEVAAAGAALADRKSVV